MGPRYRRAALLWLTLAARHLAAVRRMVDDGVRCDDVMQQLPAAQDALEQAQRLVLREHLRRCVADAVVRGGMDDAIIDRLMEALPYTEGLIGGRAPQGQHLRCNDHDQDVQAGGAIPARGLCGIVRDRASRRAGRHPAHRALDSRPG